MLSEKAVSHENTNGTKKEGKSGVGWRVGRKARNGFALVKFGIVRRHEATKGIQGRRRSGDDLEGVIPDTSVIRVIFIFLDGKASWSKGQRVNPIGVG